MAKTQKEPEIHPKTFSSLREIQIAREKLQQRLAEVNALDDKKLNHDDPQIEPIEQRTVRTILEIYGTNSPEYFDHRYFRFWDGETYINMKDSGYQKNYEKGLAKGKEILNGLILELAEKEKYIHPSIVESTNDQQDKRKCFIVHGRNEEAKTSVARFLEKIGIEVVILHEKPNGGKTIIEKFEEYSDVGFAIIILSDDDYGCYKGDYREKDSLTLRARQNVVFEFGYFIGKMGRSKVAAITVGTIEQPSDIDGIVYIKYDLEEGWKLKLSKELKTAGIEYDVSKLFE